MLFRSSFTTLATVHIFLGEERSIPHLQSLVRNWIWSDRPLRRVFEKNPRQFLWNSATQTTTGILLDIPSFGKFSTLVGPRDKSHCSRPSSSTAPACPPQPRAPHWQRRSVWSTKTTIPPTLPNCFPFATSNAALRLNDPPSFHRSRLDLTTPMTVHLVGKEASRAIGKSR